MSEVSVRVTDAIADQLREWSEPVRIRLVQNPEPMFELQTVDLVAALQEAGVLVEEQATAHGAALTAEERSAMPPNIRRFVTEWVRIDGEET